jgi:hypothetical protein
VAYSCVVNAKTVKPSPGSNPCYVYGSLFNWIFLGKKALYNMQFSVFSNSISHLLQWDGELSVLGLIL